MGRVHSAYTHDPGRAHVARWALCHGAPGVVSWRPYCHVAEPPAISPRAHAPCHTVSTPPCRDTKIVSRRRSQCRTHCTPCRVRTALRVTARIASCHSPSRCPLSRYKILYRDTLLWPGPKHARCRSPLRAGQPCCSASWPCRVPCRSVMLCAPARQLNRIAPNYPVSQYNLLYHDPNWKMGSRPSSLLCTFFVFYSSSSLLATSKM